MSIAFIFYFLNPYFVVGENEGSPLLSKLANLVPFDGAALFSASPPNPRTGTLILALYSLDGVCSQIDYKLLKGPAVPFVLVTCPHTLATIAGTEHIIIRLSCWRHYYYYFYVVSVSVHPGSWVHVCVNMYVLGWFNLNVKKVSGFVVCFQGY